MDDRVAEYIARLFAPEDPVLRALREDADRSGLPPIAVPAETGRLLQVLLAAIGAKRVLEVGTLGGYSAIWMARALGDAGRILSLEIDPAHAAFARRHLAAAGVGERVEVREGNALQLLPALDGQQFDAIFLDADKEPLPTYLEWAIRLVRVGGLIIADNALRGGRVLDEEDDDPGIRGVREFNRRFASDPRIDGVVVPIGDGVAVGVRREG
ncbi:MAG TPA: O-methyltransferase [Gemmatimonadaceae bacterium]|nr:O-methyltransferase [Gemmatimonadaceae bacterium]